MIYNGLRLINVNDFKKKIELDFIELEHYFFILIF